MIEVERVSNKFQELEALKDVSLSVQRSSIYGLVCSNGAGKTTLLKILAGIYRQNSGELTIDSQPVFENDAIKARTSFIPDLPYFFPNFSIQHTAHFYAQIYPQWNQARLEKLGGVFNIEVKRRIKTLSKGMQRQVSFWLSLALMPDVMILDGPLDGLDPVMRQKVKNLIIQDVAEREMTVMISSHNLRDLEDICDYIGILHQGRMLIQKDLDDLKADVHKIQLAFRGEIPPALLQDMQPLYQEKRGRVLVLIVCGVYEDMIRRMRSYHPAVLDVLPLTLERYLYTKWGIMVMKLKTSFINRGILFNDFKRFAWISAGYLLVLLLSLPLKVFMLYSQLEDIRINNVYMYSRIFQFDTNQSFLSVMALILVPVLTGLLLFRYLQDNQAADMIHALPVKREVLYNTHIIAGILILFMPLTLTALISWALVSGLGIEQLNGIILSWLFISLLINLLFFMTSVAVGMITGMTTLQGVLTYILLHLPSGLSVLLLNNMHKYTYGFAYDYYLGKIEKLSPLIRLTEISIHPIKTSEIAVYLLSSITLYFVGRYIYQRRHIEAAGNAIAFDGLRLFSNTRLPFALCCCSAVIFTRFKTVWPGHILVIFWVPCWPIS